MKRVCELKGLVDGEPELMATITLEGDQITGEASKGYEQALDYVMGRPVITHGGLQQIAREKDPKAWFAALPSNYLGSYFWAEFPDTKEESGDVTAADLANISLFEATWREQEAGSSDAALKAWQSRQRAQQKDPSAKEPAAKQEPSVRLSKSAKRAYVGRPMETKTTLSKLETGKLGEAIVVAHLRSQGLTDAEHVNYSAANFPVDLLQNHGLIEVKTALVSNSRGKMWWGATIGQPGPAEAAWLAKATPAQKRAHNDQKKQAILERKQQALKDVGKLLGRKIAGSTYTLLVNPDTKTADIYRFPGFHLYIGFNSKQAQAAYVGSVRYK